MSYHRALATGLMLAGWSVVAIGIWGMVGSQNVDTGKADFVPFGIVVVIGCLTATAGSIMWLREMVWA